MPYPKINKKQEFNTMPWRKRLGILPEMTNVEFKKHE